REPNRALGGPHRAPQPDLRTTLEHGDDHHVGDADPPDEESHSAEAQEERREWGLCGSPWLGGLRRAAALPLFRMLGVRGRAEHAANVVEVVRIRADVDRRGRAFGAEELLRDGKPDQRGAVEVGCELDWVEDAHDGEPPISEPDVDAGPADAEAL